MIKNNFKKLHSFKFSTNKSVLGEFGYGANDIKEFMRNDDKIRIQALSIIKENTDHVYASILNKKSINRTTWTPETIGNFMFNRSLFDHVFPNLHTIIPPKIIIDAGRLSGKKLNSFYEYMDKSESYRAFTKKKNILVLWIIEFMINRLEKNFRKNIGITYGEVKAQHG